LFSQCLYRSGRAFIEWVRPKLVALITLLSQPMRIAVAAMVMTPVAIKAAVALGADPKDFALAVPVATSAGFLMPFGHRLSLLIRELGGYRIMDCLKFEMAGRGQAIEQKKSNLYTDAFLRIID
jgi:hypothetical protein